MANGKAHFTAGAVVGATVNVIVQSTQMAMDYDRPFDWGEFFLCTGAGAFAGLAARDHRNASLPLPKGEGRGEGEGSVRKPITQNLGIVDLLFPRQFFHTILSAALVAWAISGKHTLKFSRATRLALWVFGISYLSHIALDCTTPKRINLI
jgi:hypothetical protein